MDCRGARVGHAYWFEFVAAVPVRVKLHTFNRYIACMYLFLERLAQGVFFEVLNQKRDGVGVGPCFGGRRSGARVKIKVAQQQEFVVGGYRPQPCS
jgi:hypothetical protein